MKKIIYTKNAPEPVGAYSQAIMLNDTLYTSGQIAIDPETGNFLDSDIKTQTEQVIKNLQALLDEVNMTFDDVVKTTCYLAYISDFKKFNSIYEKYFTSKPARSCVAVKELPLGALVEIEITASK